MMLVKVACDRMTETGPCQEWLAGWSVQDVRARARAKGWETSPMGMDRCPSCVAETARRE